MNWTPSDDSSTSNTPVTVEPPDGFPLSQNETLLADCVNTTVRESPAPSNFPELGASRPVVYTDPMPLDVQPTGSDVDVSHA